MSNDAKLENHRYRYLIETRLYQLCAENNDRDVCHHANEHVKRAREFGMTEQAIYERLCADNWYEDQADGDDVFHEGAWSRKEAG